LSDVFAPLTTFVALSIVLYASFLKLATRILRYSVLWKHVFTFAIVMTVIVILARPLDFQESAAIQVGHRIVLLLGLVMLGSWFFSTRGQNGSGEAIQWSGGAKLVGLAFAMMLVAAVVVAIPAHIFLTKYLSSPH
jgi:hypothetical protein